MSLIDRLPRADARWLVLLLCGCAAVGLVTGISPVYGLGLALGLTFAAAAISNLTIGLVMFTGLSFLEVLNSASNTSTSFMKIVGLLLFGSWYLTTSLSRSDDDAATRVAPAFIVACVALVAWSAMSMAWAESPGAAATASERFLLNILLFPIVLTAVRRREQLLWVLGAFLVGAAISTVYGFAAGASNLGQSGRLTGGIGDANEEAAVLVAAVPIAIGLVAALRHRPALRLAAGGLGILCFAGVINTLSRGGLIALAVVMLASVAIGGRWRGKAIALVLVATLGTVVYFVAIAPISSQSRVTSSDTSGRNDIWTIGWRMVQAHPFTGVGSGNFQNAAFHYLQRPGAITNANLIVDVPHVAHNIYLEMLSDLGIPGLLAFVAIVAASLLAASRAAREFRQSGEPDLELLARCLMLSLIGFMAADFFLSGEFSKQLWLVLALCPATLVIAKSRARRELSPEFG
jgi:putative inorganic carbon (HCO3(-)) transporter